MARKPDIQYVGQFYTHGSEARQPALKPQLKPAALKAPKFLRQEKVEVQVDPVALASTVVAVAMLILMVVSCFQYVGAVRAYEEMESYVVELQDTNARLNHDYYTSEHFDLEYVEKTALALGMVPAEQVQTVQIQVAVPQPEAEPTFWDDVRWFVEGLFA